MDASFQIVSREAKPFHSAERETFEVLRNGEPYWSVTRYDGHVNAKINFTGSDQNLFIKSRFGKGFIYVQQDGKTLFHFFKQIKIRGTKLWLDGRNFIYEDWNKLCEPQTGCWQVKNPSNELYINLIAVIVNLGYV